MSFQSIDYIQEELRDLSLNQELTKVLDLVLKTFYQPLQDDITNFLNPDLCLDVSELQAIFDPYNVSGTLADDEAQQRKYFKIIKTLYSLKGTMQGLELILKFLKINYDSIKSGRLGFFVEDLALFLDTDSPTLDPFKRIDALVRIFLPINVRLAAVTNWDAFGGINNWNLGPGILDRGLVFGMNKLDRPYGNIDRRYSPDIYFYFLRERGADYNIYANELLPACDFLPTHTYVADLDCSPNQFVQLDRNLVLGMQPILNLHNYETINGRIYTNSIYFVRSEYELPLLESAPDTAWDTLPQYQQQYEDYSYRTCFGAMILDYHAILGDDLSPMDGNQGRVLESGLLSGNFVIGKNKLGDYYKHIDAPCGIIKTYNMQAIDCSQSLALDFMRNITIYSAVDLTRSYSDVLDDNLVLSHQYSYPYDSGVTIATTRDISRAFDVSVFDNFTGEGYNASYTSDYIQVPDANDVKDIIQHRYYPIANSNTGYTIYNQGGTGSITFDATNNVTLAPQAPTASNQSYAAWATTAITDITANAIKDFTVSFNAKVIAQTRTGSAINANEVFWLLFNYTQTAGNISANFLRLEATQVVVGTCTINSGSDTISTENDLYTFAMSSNVINSLNSWKLTKTAGNLTFWLNYKQLFSQTIAVNDVNGSFAIFSQDANSLVNNFLIQYA